MLSDRGATAIIYLVSAIWAANMIVSMLPGSTYQPDPSIHGIFTVIVGGAFALRAKTDRKDNDDDRAGGHRR